MDTDADSSAPTSSDVPPANPDELHEDDLEVVSGGIIVDGWPLNTSDSPG